MRHLLLAFLAIISVVSATLVAIFGSKLESAIVRIWAYLLGKKIKGRKPKRQHWVVWLGFFLFLAIAALSTAALETLSGNDNGMSPITVMPPVVTVIAPSSAPPFSTVSKGFKPIVEEFWTREKDKFIQTSPNVYIDDNQVNCHIKRSDGDQYLYRSIQPPVTGDFRFTVIGQVNSWTNNCECRVGLGDKVGEGIAIGFGWFGGGCANHGPTIFPTGAFAKTFEHHCSMGDDWPWFEAGKPYRVSLEVEGVRATLFVEGEKVEKFFGTVDYSKPYDTLWVGRYGDGDWPECSVTIESVTIEPLH